MKANLRLVALSLGLMGLLSLTASAFGQTFAPITRSGAKEVSRTAKAVNYRRTGGAAKISFHGTELMQQAAGEARIENKGNRVEIEAKFDGLEEAAKFGLEYLTYVMWAISPQGRAVNLGEVQVRNGSAQVKAITDMQTFGLVVTAEPYFAVTTPGDQVVLENSVNGGETIETRYELIGRGAYSSSNTKIESAIFGIDRKTPVELFEARNALRIARNAGAEKYAEATMARAGQQLQDAEDAYRQKRDKKVVTSSARDAVQTAEEARVMAVKQRVEEEARADAAAEKQAAEDRAAKALVDAEMEAQRREQAEQARKQAEAAKVEAERLKSEAQQAAAEAAKAKEEAERARATAIREQQTALQLKQAAEAEAQRARDAAAKAESEKAQMREELRSQLNSILQTNDSARGLIVNMSDVLFDFGSYTLKPGAREKLAKVSGILLAHPGLTLQIEGHTDSVGGDDINQQLSEQRAGSVRDFLAEQGVPASGIAARGFGKQDPVASNDTPEGRQRNRRVEIVVNGDAIGKTTVAAGGPGAQN